MFSERTTDQDNAEYGVTRLNNWSFWVHLFSAVHSTKLISQWGQFLFYYTHEQCYNSVVNFCMEVM